MGDPTEFKFVFKSYSGVVGRTTDLVTLMSSLSKMRTGTTERSAAELSKRWRKTRAKERAMRTRRVGSSQSYAAENGVTTFSCWHGKEKQVNRVRSSSSSTLMATDVDTKRSWDSSSLGVKTQKRAGWVWSLVL